MPVFAYGNFITILINFILMAFVIFMLIRQLKKLTEKHEAAEAPPEVPAAEKLLSEIRDELRRRPA